MASNDWESLMNGVFGNGGRVRLDKPQKNTAEASPKPTHATVADMQQTLTKQLEQQAQEIAQLGNELTQSMQSDGLLPSAKSAAPTTTAGQPNFEGLPAVLRQQVLGQDDFLNDLILSFKRPFVMGNTEKSVQNSILLYGPKGSGRHAALHALAQELAARHILPNASIASIDLSLYPGPAQEKLFLQDLFSAFSSQSPIVAFEHYQDCHPGFLAHLSALVQHGYTNLANRYVSQKGMLVDAGNALVPNAIRQLTPNGKYLVFFSEKGPDAMAERLGSDFITCLGDLCATQPLTPSTITAIAGKELNSLAQHARTQLNLLLSADGNVRDLAASQANSAEGAAPIAAFCQRCYKALCEYKLKHDIPVDTAVALSVKDNRIVAAFSNQEPLDLFSLLRGEYMGAMQQVQQELDNIVGLDSVKEYVLRLRDNIQVQQRRTQAGMPAANLSMHMIFAGNPGTGKTTIARLVGKYLKAIGALRSGQLVEVSRADLVGRYVGHTAPLTQQVIRSALGGVLFIDEAYSLYRGKEDTFGLEAIDTLVKGMEDHRDEFVVILAGYSKEMQDFLQANSGLKSRFPNQIEFPDYTGEELFEITQRSATAKGYRLAAECKPLLIDYYTNAQRTNAAEHGNGRLARNKLEEAILNQSRRLVAEPSAPLDEILPQDFDLHD